MGLGQVGEDCALNVLEGGNCAEADLREGREGWRADEAGGYGNLRGFYGRQLRFYLCGKMVEKVEVVIHG
jgi:hypothetical protein